MNHTKSSTPVAVLTALLLCAVPAQAQGRYRRIGGVGVSRGPMRAMAMPLAVVAPRGAVVGRIVAGAPFNASRYFLGPPVRVGYGLSVGYPVAFPSAYPYSYPRPVASLAPGHGYKVPTVSSLAIIGRVGAHVTRGAARLALRLLIP
jgi:hypothetical protein